MYQTLISCQKLHDNLLNRDWLVCDCRYDLQNKAAGHTAYQQNHILGAIYLDLHDDLSGPPVTNRGRHPLPTNDSIAALFCRLGITPETQVVVYDDMSGSFAARMWWMLKHMTHDAVAGLDGGWQAWLAGNYDTTAVESSRTPCELIYKAKAGDVALMDDVAKVSLLIDSRDSARYRGEIEPIDKAAGHIPGAKHRFWKENLTEEGVFKSAEELHKEWKTLLGDMSSDEAVVYCGSGVTACHNLLAACHAGLAMPRLYAGSWSEWSSLPDNPVATSK